MLSKHNPGTTASLSCLIIRHTTWWLDTVGRDVSVGPPVRSTCQNHGWPAGWASSPPLSITLLCIPPLAPLVKWGHCPFCRSASEECGEQATQHTHARAHTHIFWCTEWNFWRPFTRIVWMSCWMKLFVAWWQKYFCDLRNWFYSTDNMNVFMLKTVKILCISFKKGSMKHVWWTWIWKSLKLRDSFNHDRSCKVSCNECCRMHALLHIHRW